MRIRIQWTSFEEHAQSGCGVQGLALILSTLLAPGTLAAFSMAFWKMAAESRIVTRFLITEGTFSHWQVWLFTALLLFVSLSALDRFAQRGCPSVS
jgi:hypothetical protein